MGTNKCVWGVRAKGATRLVAIMAWGWAASESVVDVATCADEVHECIACGFAWEWQGD